MELFKLDREFLVRVTTAVILVPLVILIIFSGGFAYRMLIGVISIVMTYEWLRLVGISLNLLIPLTSLWAVVVALILANWSGDEILALATGSLMVGGFAWIAGIVSQKPPLVWVGLGIVYIALPVTAFIWLQDRPGGAFWLMWTLLVVWAADVGGYFAGRIIGGKKLLPSISPNKTWSGFIGGTVLAGVGGILGAVIGGFGLPLIYFLVGALAGVWSQIGDLVESAVKRHFGVKDTGNIIPGHGGLLDRIDGLVLLAPAVMAGHLLFG